MDPKGKLILVSGASQGIGAATCRELATQGARLILVARTRSKLEALAADIQSTLPGSEAHVYPCDLGDPAAVQALAERVQAELGTPDILINNAGAGRWLAVDETPLEEVQSMIAAPYLAAFYLTRAFLPAMLERDSGIILSVQSPVSRVVPGGCTGYAACRYALQGFCAGLSADLHDTNIHVVEAMFGEVSSNYWANNPGADARLPGIAKALIPKMTPEQVARALVVAIRRPRRLFMRPHMVGVLILLLRIMPNIVRWLVVTTGWRRGREG